MRAMRRTRALGLLLALCAPLPLFASGCESPPTDMWISMDRDAGSGFEAPEREVRPSDTAPDGDDTTGGGGTGGDTGTGGTGGDSGGAGTGGDTGGAGAGGDSGGAGTGGTTGSGGTGDGTGGAS